MKEMKLAAWYLLAPLWIIYGPLLIVAAMVSFVLFMLGFEDSSELLMAIASVPVDLWISLDTRRDP